jgi:hypothetical protein
MGKGMIKSIKFPVKLIGDIIYFEKVVRCPYDDHRQTAVKKI